MPVRFLATDGNVARKAVAGRSRKEWVDDMDCAIINQLWPLGM